MRLAALVMSCVLLSGPAAARDWKVFDIEKDVRSPDAHLVLRIDKSAISLIRESDKAALLVIEPADVIAIWYDDYALQDRGRDWFDKMDKICREWCGGDDITIPLTLLAVGGVGYAAARPFDERQHYATIQYRKDDSVDVIALRTNWLDSFWLMTDLSQAVGKRWLNIPQQRARLVWNWADRTQFFESGSYAGKVQLFEGRHKILLWEDGKGRGIVMFFSVANAGRPAVVAAEAVTVEKFRGRDPGTQYCRTDDGARQVLRVYVDDKRATLMSPGEGCAPVQR
jgi:hypothetical protein